MPKSWLARKCQLINFLIRVWLYRSVFNLPYQKLVLHQMQTLENWIENGYHFLFLRLRKNHSHIEPYLEYQSFDLDRFCLSISVVAVESWHQFKSDENRSCVVWGMRKAFFNLIIEVRGYISDWNLEIYRFANDNCITFADNFIECIRMIHS